MTDEVPQRRRLAALGLVLLLLNAAGALAFAALGSAGGAACASLGLVAYLLGVRHAFDADHIAAIDNATRRMRQHGHRPVAIGFFFSLGHSAVVVTLTVALTLSARHVDGVAPWLAHWGLPTSLLASAVFLSLIGALNLRTLATTERNRGRSRICGNATPTPVSIGSSREMFPLGLLFGLNLDTAGEVVLLAASAAALQGLAPAPWLVMAFPLLFAAGMALADSLEGLLMLRLYDWAIADDDRSLRLNTVTTAASATLALTVAGLQWTSFAEWAGAPGLPGLASVNGAVLGAAATAVLAALWMAARLRRRLRAVAHVPRAGVVF